MGKKKESIQESFVWFSYADLATGLMISFILVFMIVNKENAGAVKEYLEPARNSKEAFDKVNERIVQIIEKKEDCSGSEIDIRQGQPETIQVTYIEGDKRSWFKNGQFTLETHAKRCLSKLGKIWLKEMYKEDEKQGVKIKILIIEGHTNSQRLRRGVEKFGDVNFLDNLELSQQRSLEVSKYIMKTTPFYKMGLPKKFDNWKKKKMTASGRSFSDRVFKKNDSNRPEEDLSKSRRVEFKYILESNLEGYKR